MRYCDAKRRVRTYKLCELFVTDAAVSPLEALRIEDTALRVDVTETDSCQDFYRHRFLRAVILSVSNNIEQNTI